MPRYVHTLLGLAATITACTPVSASDVAPYSGGSRAYDFSAVDALLTQSIDAFEGNVLVMIKQNGQLIYQFQLGQIGPDTIVHMASATKLISAGTILSVADSGHYALDDRVGDYLPLMQSQGKGDITIRQCFSMTSGLYDQSQNYEINRFLTLEESVNRIALFTPIIFAGGTQMAYHGKGMQVAGLIAQNETGLDWFTLAQQRVLIPCGMTSTSYDEFGVNPAIAGGARSTANDYLRYLEMIDNGGTYNGQQVLSPAAIAELFTNQSFGLPIYYVPPSIADGSPWFPYGAEDIWYGFGSWVLARNPSTGRVEEISSPGAWGSFSWIDKRRGTIGMLVTDVPPGGQATDPALHAFELIRQAIDRVTLGDLNCDGRTDFLDIDPFVLALSGEAAYAQVYPNCSHLRADCDRDGDVDFADIDAFVARFGNP